MARGTGGGAREGHRASRPEAGKPLHHQRWPSEDSGFRSGQADSCRKPSSGADAPTLHAVTEPGLIMGTVGYMSPEQVRGQAADPRSDIFAFGAILYEMISGKRAFHGETSADTMSAILKEEVPELSETARNVPARPGTNCSPLPGEKSFAAFPFRGRPGVRPGIADRDFRHQQQIGRAGSGARRSGARSRVANWRAWRAQSCWRRP